MSATSSKTKQTKHRAVWCTNSIGWMDGRMDAGSDWGVGVRVRVGWEDAYLNYVALNDR